MTGEIKQRLETIAAPYGREVRLEDVQFESGMQLLRITIREGRRITMVDIDAETATAWAGAMLRWASRASSQRY
jgi:hypothetical protein